MDQDLGNRFGEALIEARSKRRITQREAAALLKVNRVTYTRWELGHRIPSFLIADKICREFGISFLIGLQDGDK